MAKFAANLTMLFNEYDFLDRFEQAHKAGFKAVEYLFPYAYKADELAQKLQKFNLHQELFNAPPGDWDGGDRGLAALPERKEEFLASLPVALDYLQKLGCKKLHIMAGVIPSGEERKIYEETFIENFRIAADFFAPHNITLLIEPLNTRSVPDYFVNTHREASRLIKLIGKDNVKLQFDLFHAQIMEGDFTQLLNDLKADIAHIQVASIPSRFEPHLEEVNFKYFCELSNALAQYDGYIGLEYSPKTTTEEGLIWLKDFT